MSRDSDGGVPGRSREPGAATPGRTLVLTADAPTLADFDDLCSAILVEIDPTVAPAAVVTPEGVDTWAYESSE